MNRFALAAAVVMALTLGAAAHAPSAQRWASQTLNILASRPKPWVYPDLNRQFPSSVYITVSTLVGEGHQKGTRHYLRATLRQGKNHFRILIRTWGGFVYYCCKGRHGSRCIAFDPRHPTTLLSSRGGGFYVRVRRHLGKTLEFRGGFAKAASATIDLGALLPTAPKARLIRATGTTATLEISKTRSTPGEAFSCLVKFRKHGGHAAPQLVSVYDTWHSVHGRPLHSVGIYQIPGGIAKDELRAGFSLADLRKAGFHLVHGGGKAYVQLLLGSLAGGVPSAPSPAAMAGLKKLLSVLQAGPRRRGSPPPGPAAPEAPSVSALIPALRGAVYSHYALATCMEHVAVTAAACRAARATAGSADDALAALLPKSFGRKGVADLFNGAPGAALSPGWDRLQMILNSQGPWYFSARALPVAAGPNHVCLVSVMAGKLLSDGHLLVKIPDGTLRVRKVVVKSLSICGFQEYSLRSARLIGVAVPPDTVVVDAAEAKVMANGALTHVVPAAKATDFPELQHSLEAMVPVEADAVIRGRYFSGLAKMLYLRGFSTMDADGVRSVYTSALSAASKLVFRRDIQLRRFVALSGLGAKDSKNALSPLRMLWLAQDDRHPLLDFALVFAMAGARRVNGEQMTPTAGLIARGILDNMLEWLTANTACYPELPELKKHGPRSAVLFCGLWKLSTMQLRKIARHAYLPSKALAEIYLLDACLDNGHGKGHATQHRMIGPANEAIALAPQTSMVELQGGKLLLRVGDLDGATAVLARLVGSDNGGKLVRAEGMETLGAQAFKSGNYKAAIKWFRDEIKACPSRLRADYDLAYVYASSGDGKLALPILHRLVRELPTGTPMAKSSRILLGWIDKQPTAFGR